MFLGWGFVNRYVQFKGRNTEDEGIKVVSYNVQNFTGTKASELKENANKILEFLNNQDARYYLSSGDQVAEKEYF